MRSGGQPIIRAVSDEASPQAAGDAGAAEEGREFDLARATALSDGVFAFALTLLVLSITVPVLKGSVTSGDVVNALADRSQELISWVVSFVVLGGFWIRHNSFSRTLARVDSRFLVLNLAFLALVAFIPYPTEIIGRYPTTASFVFYAVFLSLLIIVSAAGAEYAASHGLLRRPETEKERRVRLSSAFRPAFFFLLSIPVALLFGPVPGYACWLALIPFDLLAGRMEEKKP